MRRIICLLLLVSLFPSLSGLRISPAEAQGGRLALVIGNSDYRHTPRLENPKNDAQDIATALEGLGFQVVKGLDLDKVGMERTIREFAERLAGANAALFYYAGHGLQVTGQNYLVPVDAKLTTAAGLDFELIRMDLVHRMMEREVGANILFLDACRDNPLARNLARALGTRSMQIGRGLASVESGEGTLISFSTQPGNVALDGSGRNSPFAKALLSHIARQGDDLQTILIHVRNDVMASTERRQVPWEHSSMTSRFFFSEPSAPGDQDAEIALWKSVEGSSDPTFIETYLKKYPQGAFAAVARNLIAALERQREVEKAARQLDDLRKAQEELRKAQDELRKAQQAAKAALPQPANNPNAAAPRTAESPSGPPKAGGHQTCGRNGCQWVPAGCRAIRGGGGGGLGGKIVCP